MEIRFTLEEPLKSAVLQRMVSEGKSSARAVVIQILKESVFKPSTKKKSHAQTK